MNISYTKCLDPKDQQHKVLTADIEQVKNWDIFFLIRGLWAKKGKHNSLLILCFTNQIIFLLQFFMRCFFVLCKSVWFSPTAMLTWKKGSLRQRMEIKMSRAFWHCKACTIIHYGGKTRHAMDVLPRFFISKKKCCCGIGGGKTDIFFSGVGLKNIQRCFKWKVILEYYTGNMKVSFVNATVLLTSKLRGSTFCKAEETSFVFPNK